MTPTRGLTDYEIQAAIIKRLDWSPVVSADHVGVAVTDGAVTLSGELATDFEMESAIHAATQVSGVSAVANELVVRYSGGAVNDADIARSVQTMLEHHDLLRGQAVTATVHDQVVTLAGVVEDDDQRDAARRATAAAPGVKSVINSLTILPTPSADQVREAMTEALEHGAERESGYLTIDVDRHVVTLAGTVHSHYDRRVAERAAGMVPGVTWVNNQLSTTY